MATKSKRISIVVPVYFEEAMIETFHARLMSVVTQLPGYGYEIVYVNDGSKDRSAEILDGFSASDPNVVIVHFARNFGKEQAATAGIDYAKGDAVVLIDADLQDPPELILDMIPHWEQGVHNVYAKRTKRRGEGPFKIFTSKMFYRTMNMFSDVRMPVDTGDYRLMDRALVDAFKTMREGNRYVRGLVSWMGFSSHGIEFERDERFAGDTKWSPMKLVGLALNAILSFSDKPLTLVSYLGLFITFVAFCYLVFVFVSYFVFPQNIEPGWTSLMSVVLFLGGIQLLSLGVIGQYVGRIYREAKGRPLYVVDRVMAATPPAAKRRTRTKRT